MDLLKLALGWLFALTLVVGLSSCCLQIIGGASIHGGAGFVAQDAGIDAGPDAGMDAGADAGMDAGPDAGTDAGVDAGMDAGPDAGADAGLDAGPNPDSGMCSLGRPSNLGSAITYSSWTALASADLNGDGLLDLVTTGSLGFTVFLGLADGGLIELEAYQQGSGEAVAIGDLNGDGTPDVAVAGPDVLLFTNDGSGNLTEFASIPMTWSVEGIAIADFTGDGLADLLVTENAYGRDAGNDCPVQLLVNDGDGSFTAMPAFPGISGTCFGGIAAADFNGDGLPDFVANNVEGTDLAVMLNMGDGGFSTTLYPAPAAPTVVVLQLGSSLAHLVVGTAGFAGGGSIQVLKNRGDGTFAVGPQIGVPGGWFLTVGDFNGDCLPDIADGTLENCGQESWSISVLYGLSDGGLSPPQALQAAYTAPSGMAALGPVGSRRALAIADNCQGGVAVYGDASR